MLPYGANRDLRRDNVGTRHRGHSEYYVQWNVICTAFGRCKDFYFCSATSDTPVSSRQVVVASTATERGRERSREKQRKRWREEYGNW